MDSTSVVESLKKMLENSADIAAEEYEELKGFLVNVQEIVEDFKKMRPYVVICLLDCCRIYCLRNPDLQRFTARAISMPKYQRDIIGPGSLIAFACSAGTIASENDKQGNALFTKYLLQHINRPNMDISKVLRAVTRDVREESKGRQIPHYVAALMTEDDICLFETVTGR